MNRALLSGLSTLLFPFAAHAAATSAGGYLMRGGYQPRSHARLQIDALSPTVTAPLKAKPSARHAAAPTDVATLDILQQPVATELVVIDGAITDKATLYRGLKPGVVAVEIDPSRPGLPQLADALRGHRNLAAIHVVSHASAGVLLLGNSRITPENAHDGLAALSTLRQAVRPGADLLFYGCDLAASTRGSALLDIFQQQTGLDVAASSNLTGSTALGGDWDLEVVRGSIESTLAFSDKALRDFSQVLVASNGTRNFSGWLGNGTAQLYTTDFRLTARDGNGNNQIVGTYNTGISYMMNGNGNANHYLYLKADGTNTTAFELTGLTAGEAPMLGGAFTNVRIEGQVHGGGTVNSSTLMGNGLDETFTFGSGQLSAFTNIKLQGFKLYFDCDGPCANATVPASFEFRNFTIQNAINTPPPPTVTDGRISISGASGTSSAFKIGDTVTATWDNTAVGDNNSGITGVTMNFSQFGGGSAVAATNSSGTWTATYTITGGSIDATNRNVSVTATSAIGSTTRADSTNATVDSIAPTVTDGRISISGASGVGGAYRIGDTVTATWDNTAGGDNNLDTISSATVNFSQFGGAAAVAATNSSGTWTANYTIVGGAIAMGNRNVSVTAIDDAGNATTASDSTNATVDNIAPSVSSITVSGSPASGDTSMAFTVNFSELVGNVSTDDFTLVRTGSAFGSIASVSASTGSAVDVNIVGISGTGTFKVNLNGGTNIVDGVGNSGPAAYTSGSTHTVNILTAPGAPTIGTATAGDAQASVTFTAPGNNGGSAITTYTATSNPEGKFGSCAGPAACTATVNGLTNGTAYTFTVTATNGVGTSTASGISNSVTPKGNQTITFGNPGTRSFGTSPTLTATASSGLTPTFTSSTTGVCTITSGGALTFVTAGPCTIDADQAGNGTWSAAATVTQPFNVDPIVPGAPTIGTATAGTAQATVTFTAPASTGGAPILAGGYTVTADPGGATGTGSSSPITVTGLTNGTAYSFRVTATNSAGTGSASAASNTVTPAAPQTITFADPGARDFGTSPTLTASSSAGAGYVVTFTSSTPGVCTVSGTTLTFLAAGTCTIDANQAGDASYLAAPQISRSFPVNAVVPGVPTSPVATAGDTQASIAFVAPVNIGGSAITDYTVTVNPPDVAPVKGGSSPIVVTGLTNGVAYSFTVKAENAAGLGSASVASNQVTPRATQTITFAPPSAQNFGTTPTLAATSDSGLMPTFTSSTTGVCTITSVGALTFVTAGACAINADQAGNATYLPAPQVTRSFQVTAVPPTAPTMGTATAGDSQASVAFTAPTSSGGAVITNYIVTVNPGGATVTGTSSPIAVPGLVNGTTYNFTVKAINSAGPGLASGISNDVIPRLLTVVGNLPGTTSTASATLSGGGDACTLDPTSGFASVSNPPPAGKTMPYGEYAFQAAGCVGSVTMSITYPQSLGAGIQFWKYGPATAGAAQSTWFQLNGATLSADGKTVTYTIADNGMGDSDPAQGSIRDPFAPVAGPAMSDPASIPVDAPWALALLTAMLGWLGWRMQRQAASA